MELDGPMPLGVSAGSDRQNPAYQGFKSQTLVGVSGGVPSRN